MTHAQSVVSHRTAAVLIHDPLSRSISAADSVTHFLPNQKSSHCPGFDVPGAALSAENSSHRRRPVLAHVTQPGDTLNALTRSVT